MAAGSPCSSDTESSTLSSEILTSSDFSDDECVSGPLPGMEILPYQYEPVASSDGHSSDSSSDSPAPITGAPDEPSIDRAGNVNW